MELEFEMDKTNGLCFTLCPFFYDKGIMINSNNCYCCDYNYGLSKSGKLLCKGNIIDEV